MFEDMSAGSDSADRPSPPERRVGAGHAGELSAAEISAALESGPGVANIAALASVDPDRVSADTRVQLLQGWARHMSWAQAQLLRTVRAVAGPDVPLISNGLTITDPGREEVALALGMAASTASELVHLARAMCGRHAGTLAAMETGSISYPAARALVDVCDGLPREQVAVVESFVLPTADGRAPSQIRRAARRVLARIAPDRQRTLSANARSGRCVTVYPQEHGMAVFSALLPVVQANRLYDAVDATARRAAEVERQAQAAGLLADTRPTLEQRRADALVELVSRGYPVVNQVASAPDHDVRTPAGRPHRPERRAAVIIDLPTALGLADHPGEIPGYGPIPADLAREIASDAEWVRWVVDPVDGDLLDVGRKRYTPSERLRDFIAARDGVCRFPGCNQPAHRTDLDHAVAWDAGGESTRANLGALCRRHHRMKTAGLWKLTESQTDGSCTWIGPSGQLLETTPDPPLAQFQVEPEPEEPPEPPEPPERPPS